MLSFLNVSLLYDTNDCTNLNSGVYFSLGFNMFIRRPQEEEEKGLNPQKRISFRGLDKIIENILVEKVTLANNC